MCVIRSNNLIESTPQPPRVLSDLDIFNMNVREFRPDMSIDARKIAWSIYNIYLAKERLDWFLLIGICETAMARMTSHDNFFDTVRSTMNSVTFV